MKLERRFKHRIELAEGIGEEDKKLIPGDSCLFGDLGYCRQKGRSWDVRLMSLPDGFNDLGVDLDVHAGIKGG
jgi:hypothetical protein